MKLDFKYDTTTILSEIIRFSGLSPFLLMSLAVFAVVFTSLEISEYTKVELRDRQTSKTPRFEVKRTPVKQSLYENYATILSRLSTGVAVTGSAKGLSITIADALNYPEFMFVLNSIQGLSKDVVWTADEICLAKCTGGASTAVIRGVTESVVVKPQG